MKKIEEDEGETAREGQFKGIAKMCPSIPSSAHPRVRATHAVVTRNKNQIKKKGSYIYRSTGKKAVMYAQVNKERSLKKE